MTDHTPMPVAGYTAQSDQRIALANEGKALEERYMRWLDKLQHGPLPAPMTCDPRCIERARTGVQEAAMWAVRSIFQPQRIELPGDEPPLGDTP